MTQLITEEEKTIVFLAELTDSGLKLGQRLIRLLLKYQPSEQTLIDHWKAFNHHQKSYVIAYSEKRNFKKLLTSKLAGDNKSQAYLLLRSLCSIDFEYVLQFLKSNYVQEYDMQFNIKMYGACLNKRRDILDQLARVYGSIFELLIRVDTSRFKFVSLLTTQECREFFTQEQVSWDMKSRLFLELQARTLCDSKEFDWYKNRVSQDLQASKIALQKRLVILEIAQMLESICGVQNRDFYTSLIGYYNYVGVFPLKWSLLENILTAHPGYNHNQFIHDYFHVDGIRVLL